MLATPLGENYFLCQHTHTHFCATYSFKTLFNLLYFRPSFPFRSDMCVCGKYEFLLKKKQVKYI